METTQQNGTRLAALDAPGASSTALALRQPALMEAYTPRSYQEAIAMASTLGKAARITPEEAFLKMAVGAEYDIPATTALRQVDIIDGPNNTKQVGFRAQLMVSLCLRRKDICEFFRFVSADEKHATYTAKRVGDPEPVTVTYTIEQAAQAKLIKKDGAYEKDPESQLIARASARLARRVFPDIIGNVYTPEEIAEGAQSRDVTPLPTSSAAPVSTTSRAPSQPVDAEVVGGGADEDRVVALLERAKTDKEVTAGAAEALRVWPQTRPQRVKDAHVAAKKRVAEQAAAKPAETPPASTATPPHDEKTGEVREPGADDGE